MKANFVCKMLFEVITQLKGIAILLNCYLIKDIYVVFKKKKYLSQKFWNFLKNSESFLVTSKLSYKFFQQNLYFSLKLLSKK